MKQFFTLISFLCISYLAIGQLSLNITINDQVSCEGATNGSVSLEASNGTAPYAYIWADGTMDSTNMMLGTGTHYFTITDANGLNLNDSITLTAPVVINVSLDSVPFMNCDNSTSQINSQVNGGDGLYSYEWSNDATSPNLAGVLPNTYMLTVTDNTGCIGSDTIVLPNTGSSPELSLDIKPITCRHDNDAAIDLTVMGGVPPYTYQWSPSSTMEDIDGLSAGTYSILVTDDGGCAAFSSVEITQPDLFELFPEPTPATQGNNDGAVNVLPEGGVAPYTYAWDTGDSTQFVQGLATGTYTVTVIDANGCVNIEDVIIELFSNTNNISTLENAILAPNPTHNLATLNLTFNQNEDFQFAIYNALGQTITTSTLQGQFLNIPIDLTSYTKGIYFIEIKTKLERQFFKIVKE